MSVYLDTGKPVTASYLLPSKQVSHPQRDPAGCADLRDEVTPTSLLQYPVVPFRSKHNVSKQHGKSLSQGSSLNGQGRIHTKRKSCESSQEVEIVFL